MSQISVCIEKYGKESLIEVYRKGGRKALAEYTKLRYNSIGHLCKEIGVYNREDYLHQRERIHNEHWECNNPFKQDNDIKWYLLGYIVGDGSIRLHHGYYYLSIASSDKDHIEKLASCFGKVSWESRKGCYQFTVGNKDVLQDIIELGVKPNKSVEGCELVLNMEWVWSFLRGLLDSDGYVRNVSSSNEITWYGHKSYIQQISSILGRPVHYSDGLARVSIHSKEDITKVLVALYANAEIKLERKYNRCVQILEHYGIQMKK